MNGVCINFRCELADKCCGVVQCAGCSPTHKGCGPCTHKGRDTCPHHTRPKDFIMDRFTKIK